MYNKTPHQKKQLEVISGIEKQIESNSLNFSTVAPVSDFDNDPRVCLTSVHFPHQQLINQITQLTEPLKIIDPDHYYYHPNSLHLTIKNIRVMSIPPNFDDTDIDKVAQVFSQVIPKHKAFRAFYYRLMTFPANLSLVGTTDPELDKIFLELDSELKNVGVPDDKKYANEKYFFSNITLMRFTHEVSQQMREQIEKLSSSLDFEPYLIDSVSLVRGNATLSQCQKINTWSLQ